MRRGRAAAPMTTLNPAFTQGDILCPIEAELLTGPSVQLCEQAA